MQLVGGAEVRWDYEQKLVVPRGNGTVTEIGGAEVWWDYRNVFVCKVLHNVNLLRDNFKGHRTLTLCKPFKGEF